MVLLLQNTYQDTLNNMQYLHSNMVLLLLKTITNYQGGYEKFTFQYGVTIT